MAEEAVADAGAFGGALDQAGNVGEDEIDLAVADDAELRMEGGEGIIADLGLGVGDRVEKGRLAGIGQADQAGIGDQLEPQPDPQFLARPAGAVLARGAVGRGLVAGIAAAAVAALEQDYALADLGEVGEDISLSSSSTWVPTGTLTTRSLPPAPVWSRPAPPLPRGARKCWV